MKAFVEQKLPYFAIYVFWSGVNNEPFGLGYNGVITICIQQLVSYVLECFHITLGCSSSKQNMNIELDNADKFFKTSIPNE